MKTTNYYFADYHTAADLSTLKPEVLEDLKFQLHINLTKIISCYGSYVDCIRMSVTSQGVTAKDLKIFLMGFSAFSHREQQIVLFSGSKFRDAHDVADIFELLIEEYASFMNYEIFQIIQKRYVFDEGQEALKYPKHLKEYVEKLKYTEFIEIKGGLREVPEKNTDTSQKMILKIEIEKTCNLAKLLNLKNDIARILGITPLGLQLIDVEEGCVVVTLLVLYCIADAIFTGQKKKIFSPEQILMFQVLSVQWLKCKDYEWNFIEDRSNVSGNRSGQVGELGSQAITQGRWVTITQGRCSSNHSGQVGGVLSHYSGQVGGWVGHILCFNAWYGQG